MRKYISAMITGILLINLSACSSKTSEQPAPAVQSETSEAEPEKQIRETSKKELQGKTFSDPETLINEFIQQAKVGDLDTLTEFFAINYVEFYDEDAENADIMPPITIDERTGEVYQELTKFYTGLSLPLEELLTVLLRSDLLESVTKESVTELMKIGDYGTLEVVRIDLLKQDQQTHDEMTANLRTSEKLYSADSWDYRTVLMSMNGQTYCCCFSFIIYDGNYQLMAFDGAMLYLDSNLAAIPCSEEEYLEMIQ